MNILHLSFSARGEHSESLALSRRVVSHLLAGRADARMSVSITERMLGAEPLPHIDANYSLAQHSVADPIQQGGSMARSDEAIAQLEQADVIVIGTPMHNLSVPSALKAWLDHVVRARHTFTMTAQGKVGTLRDRPVLIAIASGGRFSGEHARQPDFLTPYLRELLKTIGLSDLHFFSVEGTGAPPEAVAKAREAAERSLQRFFAAFRAPG